MSDRAGSGLNPNTPQTLQRYITASSSYAARLRVQIRMEEQDQLRLRQDLMLPCSTRQASGTRNIR